MLDLHKLINSDLITIPEKLITNYKRLNLSEEELIILLQIIANTKNNKKVSVSDLTKSTNYSLEKVNSIFEKLFEKKYVEVKIIKHNDERVSCYSFNNLYDKLLTIDSDNSEIDKNTQKFRKLAKNYFGKILSIDDIKEDIKNLSETNDDFIEHAFKESKIQNKTNIKSVVSILNTWTKLGAITLADADKISTNWKKNNYKSDKPESSKDKEIKITNIDW